MNSFTELTDVFEKRFAIRHFPGFPARLYDASQYILSIGGKRIRPVSVLMGNELFADISEDAFHAATAIELFHNFSLIHDDIMDKAPLRRGLETVHTKFGDATALLSGDVMLVGAYEALNKISGPYLHDILSLFNSTAKMVCEGQQLDMDFEKSPNISLEAYLDMISRKTSVLLGCSFQLGAIIGGAGLGNQNHLYNFGKDIGIAFQVQDDYLDAFGDPKKVGKQTGGDILADKKTFLMIHAMEVASEEDQRMIRLLQGSADDKKISKILNIFRRCKVDEWARELKDTYYRSAMNHLESIAVLSSRKKELENLAGYLIQREY